MAEKNANSAPTGAFSGLLNRVKGLFQTETKAKTHEPPSVDWEMSFSSYKKIGALGSGDNKKNASSNKNSTQNQDGSRVIQDVSLKNNRYSMFGTTSTRKGKTPDVHSHPAPKLTDDKK